MFYAISYPGSTQIRFILALYSLLVRLSHAESTSQECKLKYADYFSHNLTHDLICKLLYSRLMPVSLGRAFLCNEKLSNLVGRNYCLGKESHTGFGLWDNAVNLALRFGEDSDSLLSSNIRPIGGCFCGRYLHVESLLRDPSYLATYPRRVRVTAPSCLTATLIFLNFPSCAVFVEAYANEYINLNSAATL